MQGFELRLQNGFDHTNTTDNQNHDKHSNFIQSLDIESVFQTPEESWVTSPTYISNFSNQAVKDIRNSVFFSEAVPTDSSVLEESFSTHSSEDISDLLTVSNYLKIEEEEATTMQSEPLPNPGKFRIE